MGIKISIEEVRNRVAAIGYTLVSIEYNGVHDPIEVLCPNGHHWITRLSDIHNGNQRCPTCQGIKRFTVTEVIDNFSKSGYIAHLTEYVNARKRINTTCPNGHPWLVTYYKFLSGQRCSKCVGKLKFTLEEVTNSVSKRGYTLLSSEYIEANHPLKMVCPKKHEVVVSFWEFRKREHPCTICHPQSLPEKELLKAIKEIYTNAKTLRARKIKIDGKPLITGFDIDIFIPEINRGIEFDGTRFHSFEFMRKDSQKALWSDDDVRNYHDIKDTYFASIGIQVLHIKEADWDIDKKSCIDKCLEFLKTVHDING